MKPITDQTNGDVLCMAPSAVFKWYCSLFTIMAYWISWYMHIPVGFFFNVYQGNNTCLAYSKAWQFPWLHVL